MRFLALGDSYTIGEGVAARECWPNLLAAMLRERGHDVADPQIVARTAWTTDELHDAMAEAAPVGPFRIVTLMIGVNDQYRARPIEQFESGFVPLLDQAITHAGGIAAHVIVISIPDWGATPFAEGRDRPLISREIDLYNTRMRELATQRGASFHDVTMASRRVLDDASLVVSDGLHPSGEMYREWAESLLPLFEALLAR